MGVPAQYELKLLGLNQSQGESCCDDDASSAPQPPAELLLCQFGNEHNADLNIDEG